ncbi:MAG: capsular polysaccharide synthesis protein [Streptococcaceae bacterium]|nr:capsular polysaccharide synthesis protein [Streptococcaceae bacterium]
MKSKRIGNLAFYSIKALALICRVVPTVALKKFFRRYHQKLILAVLRYHFSEEIDKWSTQPNPTQPNPTQPNPTQPNPTQPNPTQPSIQSIPKIIWNMWWQGEDEAPDMVKMCWRSMRKQANDFELRIITRENYQTYLEVPEEIIQNLESGKLTFAGFSDYIRISLLVKYGGLWLDSTTYLSGKIPEDMLHKSFISRKIAPTYVDYPDHIHFPGHLKFDLWFLGAPPETIFMRFIQEAMTLYLMQNNRLISYFYFGFFIELAYQENVGAFKDILDDVKANNQYARGELLKILNHPMNLVEIGKVVNEANWLHKLTYKWVEDESRQDKVIDWLRTQ